MSGQIIDSQKRINQLEAKLLASEERKSYIESLIKSRVKAKRPSVSVPTLNTSGKSIQGWAKQLSVYMHNLSSHMPSWLKA